MAEPNPQKPAKDGYPLMIMTCIGITAVLFLVIAGVLIGDYVQRKQMGTEAPPPGFESMLEKPRPVAP